MQVISLRGPFLWLWALNLLYLYALSVWGWLVGDLVPLMAVWLTWFLVMEIVGAIVNARSQGPEVARTFSQIMQYFAHRDKGSSFFATLMGWDAMVTGSALLLSINAGWVVAASTTQAGGWVVGVAMFAWNYGHWHNRRRHG